VSGRERGFAFSSDWLSHAVNCDVESMISLYQNVRVTVHACFNFICNCEFIIIIAATYTWLTSWFILMENLAVTLYEFSSIYYEKNNLKKNF